MSRYMVFLKIPEDTALNSMPDNLRLAIKQVFARWSTDTLSGSRPVGGYRLIRARVSTNIATIKYLIQQFAIDWTVLGMATCKKQPQYQDDGDGGQVTVMVDEGLEAEHQLYLRDFELKLDSEILSYLYPDATADEQGNITETPKTIPCALSVGASDDPIGQAPSDWAA